MLSRQSVQRSGTKLSGPLKKEGLYEGLLASLEAQAFTQTDADRPPDIVEWSERFIILPTGASICFEEHQKKILQHVFTFDESGKLPYSIIVYSCIKKSGKTAIT